jgi:hypothetical protein
VRSGHDRVEVTGEVARGGLMSEAVVAQSGEHEGAIRVDLGAGGDDLAGDPLSTAENHTPDISPPAGCPDSCVPSR